MRTHRILSLLLAAVLALLPGFAQGTSEQALQEQVDALVAQIAELQQQDPTFVYNGETYHVSMALNTPTNISSRPTITILFLIS